MMTELDWIRFRDGSRITIKETKYSRNTIFSRLDDSNDPGRKNQELFVCTP